MSSKLTPRIAAAEAVGTCAYCCANVGAGIMAEQKLVDDGLVLLAVSLATGVALAVLTAMFDSISDSYFNPAQTIADAAEDRCSLGKLAILVGLQLVGAYVGVLVAHAMFGMPLLELSAKARPHLGQILAECIATAGLLTVSAGTKGKPWHSLCVGGWIFAAHWFASSMSQANPALTIARMFTTGPTGVRYQDVPQLVAGQLAGIALGLLLRRIFFRHAQSEPGGIVQPQPK